MVIVLFKYVLHLNKPNILTIEFPNGNFGFDFFDIIISSMARYNDIFDEFFNYIRINKMQRKDGTKVTIAGYTAEKLMEQYNLSVIGAYNFLVYLREDPKEALADLKAGLPRK